jgi:hypothetical protein
MTLPRKFNCYFFVAGAHLALEELVEGKLWVSVECEVFRNIFFRLVFLTLRQPGQAPILAGGGEKGLVAIALP